jgi:hypothetical protein
MGSDLSFLRKRKNMGIGRRKGNSGAVGLKSMEVPIFTEVVCKNFNPTAEKVSINGITLFKTRDSALLVGTVQADYTDKQKVKDGSFHAVETRGVVTSNEHEILIVLQPDVDSRGTYSFCIFNTNGIALYNNRNIGTVEEIKDGHIMARVTGTSPLSSASVDMTVSSNLKTSNIQEGNTCAYFAISGATVVLSKNFENIRDVIFAFEDGHIQAEIAGCAENIFDVKSKERCFECLRNYSRTGEIQPGSMRLVQQHVMSRAFGNTGAGVDELESETTRVENSKNEVGETFFVRSFARARSVEQIQHTSFSERIRQEKLKKSNSTTNLKTPDLI